MSDIKMQSASIASRLDYNKTASHWTFIGRNTNGKQIEVKIQIEDYELLEIAQNIVKLTKERLRVATARATDIKEVIQNF